MTWLSIATIALTQDWQYTAPVAGSLVRLRHNLAVTDYWGFRGHICQAFNDGGNRQLYQIRRFYAKPEFDLYQLIPPVGADDRQIGLRRRDRYLNPWSVAIDVWEGSFSQSNAERLFVPVEGQTIFTLSDPPQFPQLSELYVNGVKAEYGSDYSISGVLLTWLSELILEPSDEVEIYY